MVKGFYKDREGRIIPDCLVEDSYKYFNMSFLSRMEYEADKKKELEKTRDFEDLTNRLKIPTINFTPKIDLPPIKPLIDFTPKINLAPIEPVKPLIDFTPKINISPINTDPLDLFKKSKKKPWELED